MGDDNIVTTTTPIYVGIIKYFENPKIKTLYPINDYLVVTLDPSIVGTKVSVCARKDFTEDQFWLNGKKCTVEFAYCLNEIKYRAANLRSVSIEFLKRKVHIVCKNKFLPATGSASFAAGFVCLVTALCKLYKLKNNDFKNHSPFLNLTTSPLGGFVQRRQTIDSRKEFQGKVIAAGSHWPELRVLVIVLRETRRLPGTTPDTVTVYETMYRRSQQHVPTNFKNIVEAIKEKNFERFAEITMQDNDQFHDVNLDTHPIRDYKTIVSRIIQELVKIYNGLFTEKRLAFSFDTGPNPTLFFLEEHAQDVISYIQYMFPTSDPDFIKGLEVPPYLGDECFSNFVLDPIEDEQIKYAIYTKIGDVSVQFATENHLLDVNGDIINVPPEEESLLS